MSYFAKRTVAHHIPSRKVVMMYLHWIRLDALLEQRSKEVGGLSRPEG